MRSRTRDCALRPLRRRYWRGQEEGFTLVELLVAIGMATVVLTAFAYASMSTLRAMHIARLNQQVADIATQHLEQLRGLAYGSLAHAPGSVVSDGNLSSCSGGYCYDGNGEKLVQVPGGSVQQVDDSVEANDFDYVLRTYVTQPVITGAADYRRVTVVADWEAYGQQWTKTMTTIVTQTQRGLPLPEFKLVAIGPTTVTVNPDAVAALGFQLINQGAPDQWNITVTGLPSYSLFLDDGDRIYNSEQDSTAMQDHSGDSAPDTGRLDPKASVVFWVVFTADGDRTFSVVAQSASQEGPAGGKSLQARVIVQAGVITASPTASPSPTSVQCAAPGPGRQPDGETGYTLRAYVLHNSGTRAWPALPLPGSGAIPGSDAMALMYLDLNPVSIPLDRDLPVYSTNLSPSGAEGRLLYAGGSFSAPSPSDVLDFRTQIANRSYKGKMILRLWAKKVGGGVPSLSAQAYKIKTNGNQAPSAVSSAVPAAVDENPGCQGFHEVVVQIPISPISIGSNNVLGVKVWNTGQTAQVAYDHGAFPATFTVVEK